MKPIVHVVHCVDTEGPLSETLEATFERLRKEKGLDLEPSLATLQALQQGAIDLGGREQDIAAYVAPSRLAYLSTWQEVEKMIAQATSPAYRKQLASPDGTPYRFSWFIIDVVGYRDNPRRKSMGFHAVWDQYKRMLDPKDGDALGWHFHTVPPTGHALHYNTSWTNNDFHEQALARRVIERGWFPSLFRAGGVIERNDISHWLERFVPFDYSNQNNPHADFSPGSQSDWRGAPMRWGAYHPSFYDYRKEGDMRRSIFRCLDVNIPGCRMDEASVDAAFNEARQNGVAVLAYTNHDRRDVRPDMETATKLIQEAAKRHPDVAWQRSDALTAARAYLHTPESKPLTLTIERKDNVAMITSNQPSFSDDIFLAVEEEGELFYRDNATIESATSWAYSTPRWNTVKRLGAAIVTADGQTHTTVLEVNA